MHADTIQVTDSPAIPGLNFRRFRGPSDYPAMAAVIEASADADKIERRRGWTEFISVRRPWRRRGLARALIARSLRIQKAEGMTESALGVDSQNLSGALRVYEDCGFQVVRRSIGFRKAL
jgi:GNAT superfamily N-acetyltransferase